MKALLTAFCIMTLSFSAFASPVTERVKEIVAEQIGIPRQDVSEEKTFKELGADDFDMFLIIMNLEDEFAIEIYEDDGLTELSRVRDAIILVENYRR